MINTIKNKIRNMCNTMTETAKRSSDGFQNMVLAIRNKIQGTVSCSFDKIRKKISKVLDTVKNKYFLWRKK